MPEMSTTKKPTLYGFSTAYGSTVRSGSMGRMIMMITRNLMVSVSSTRRMRAAVSWASRLAANSMVITRARAPATSGW